MSPPENLFMIGKFLINLSFAIGVNDIFLHSSNSYCNLLFLRPISLDTDLFFFSFFACYAICFCNSR